MPEIPSLAEAMQILYQIESLAQRIENNGPYSTVVDQLTQKEPLLKREIQPRLSDTVELYWYGDLTGNQPDSASSTDSAADNSGFKVEWLSSSKEDSSADVSSAESSTAGEIAANEEATHQDAFELFLQSNPLEKSENKQVKTEEQPTETAPEEPKAKSTEPTSAMVPAEQENEAEQPTEPEIETPVSEETAIDAQLQSADAELQAVKEEELGLAPNTAAEAEAEAVIAVAEGSDGVDETAEETQVAQPEKQPQIAEESSLPEQTDDVDTAAE